MGCDDIRDRLSEYIDGILPRPDATQVRDHLLSCSDCRTELKKLQRTVNLLRSLPQVPAPAGFALRLEARLAEQRLSWPRRLVTQLDHALSLVPLKALTAAAAAVLVLVVILSSGQHLGPAANQNLATGQNPEIPAVLAAATEPVPVEFASTHATPPVSPVYLDTPTELLMNIIRQDPSLRGYQVLPHPRGTGVLLSTPDYLYEVVMDPSEFPIIQAYIEQHGGRIPSTLREARMVYPIYIRALPSPTKPIGR